MKTLISVEEDCVKHFTLASALKLLDDVVNVIVEIIAEIMADYPPCHDCHRTTTTTQCVMSPRCQQLGQLAQEERADGGVLGVVHHVHVDHVHWRLADRVPRVETFQNLIITSDICDLVIICSPDHRPSPRL